MVESRQIDEISDTGCDDHFGPYIHESELLEQSDLVYNSGMGLKSQMLKALISNLSLNSILLIRWKSFARAV